MVKNRKNITVLITAISVVAIVAIIVLSLSRSKSPSDISTKSQVQKSRRNQKPRNQKHNDYLLFILDQGRRNLMLETVELPINARRDVVSEIKELMSLLADPAVAGENAPIPPGTYLHEVYIDDKAIAYLDFSEELIKGHVGGTTAELLTLRAIFHTIKANFKQVERIQLLINGQEVKSIAGHIDISKPIYFQENL